MNTEGITVDEVEELVANLSSAATAHLRQLAAHKKEGALISELNASKKSDRERLVAYLERTTLDPLAVRPDEVRFERTNQYLREQLGISPLKFKALRDELWVAGKIVVLTTYGRITILSFRAI